MVIMSMNRKINKGGNTERVTHLPRGPKNLLRADAAQWLFECSQATGSVELCDRAAESSPQTVVREFFGTYSKSLFQWSFLMHPDV